MKTSQNDRRDFLCKSAILLGLSPLSNLDFFENHFLSSNLQFSLIDECVLSSSIIQPISHNPSVSKLRFSTGALFAVAKYPELISELNLNAVLYGVHLKAYAPSRLESLVKSTNLPLVNSILDIGATPLGRYVQPYLIHYSGSKKIGILGCGIDKNHQSAEYIVKRLNVIAKFLKQELGCSYIICLSDCPQSNKLEFTLKDITRKSKGIHQFFAYSAQYKKDYLFVYRNSENKDTHLNQMNLYTGERFIYELTSNNTFNYYNTVV